MRLRGRIVTGTAAAVAASVALASAAILAGERQDLRNRIDQSLRERADEVVAQVYAAGEEGLAVRPPRFDAPGGYAQLVTDDGIATNLAEGTPLVPVSAAALEVAAGRRASAFEELRLDGVHVRVFTAAAGSGRAVQVARPVDEVDSHLLWVLGLLAAIMAGGVALGALLGHLVARPVLGPVERLTSAAEDVARTRDLRRRIPVTGDDELSRLGRAFNAMLEALERATDAQRRLVADVSHELRTPLTSVRTNLEHLRRAPDLPAGERGALLAEVTAELDHLTAIVRDVLDLARAEEDGRPAESVPLDQLVLGAVERVRPRRSDVSVRTALDPCTVTGVPGELERAVGNLLDNALKWSPPGGEVDVVLRDGELAIRDHGPGIPPEHLPHVCDRFYRAPAGRGLPGSGLGLAIVRKAADRQGWPLVLENADGGGTRVRLGIGGAGR